ncbi:MAG: hypothetical protein EOP04_25570 [Proteobacteria bacterium]|nr:MAG: hypothetical protein EOP04_25570 [Pseudomonadota bacterium]
MKLNGTTIFAALLFIGAAPAFADNGPPGCYTITECTQVCDAKGTCTQRCTKQTFCNADQLPPEIETEPNAIPDLGAQPLINPFKFEIDGKSPAKKLDRTITASAPADNGLISNNPLVKLHPGAMITTIAE